MVLYKLKQSLVFTCCVRTPEWSSPKKMTVHVVCVSSLVRPILTCIIRWRPLRAGGRRKSDDVVKERERADRVVTDRCSTRASLNHQFFYLMQCTKTKCLKTVFESMFSGTFHR